MAQNEVRGLTMAQNEVRGLTMAQNAVNGHQGLTKSQSNKLLTAISIVFCLKASNLGPTNS